MREWIERAVRWVNAADRAVATAELATRLGGSGLLVFLRDDEVRLLLPAPGFPQTLPDARAWRRFVQACAESDEPLTGRLVAPGTEAAEPVIGLSGGPDVVAVVLGADRVSDEATHFQSLLPLLGAALRGERAAAHADAQARAARQAAAHAEALATTLDRTRAELQRAFVSAEQARAHLEDANDQLRDQATELEMQAEELAERAADLARTNAELEAARDAAQGANRAKSEFLATMSHELRTPLNAISGHAELIAMGIYGTLTDAQREAIDRIKRSQRHLLGLINDVLNLARIEAGGLQYVLGDVSLAEVLEDLRPMIEPQLQRKELRYLVPAADDSTTVRADREKLQQVLLNLLSNAVKFTPAGGTVGVDWTGSGEDSIVVRVRDTGIGIPADKLEYIFEPFVQVDASHSRLGHGVGLGLAISRDLARGMGGDLRVTSAPGAGSMFELTLPSPTPVAAP